MVDRWTRFRIVGATVAVTASLLTSIVFRPAWIAVATGTMVLVHAVRSLHRPHIGHALSIDVVLTLITLAFLHVPVAVITIAYLAYGIASVLLGTPRQRAVIGVIASGAFATAAFLELPLAPTIEPPWPQIVGWIAASVYVALVLASVSMAIDLLQRHVETIDLANSKLDELVRSKDDLVAAISHEIRTPLTGVLGFASELSSQWDTFEPDERKELMGLIESHSHTIAHIVEDLLIAARVDLGSIAITPQSIPVQPQIRAALAELNGGGDGVVVHGEPSHAVCDAARLRQVLRNLVRNALAHGGDHVWIETDATPRGVVIAVCDDGDGVAENLRDAMFDRYQRAHSNRTQPASLGLGLTTARTLVELMGGALEYQRADGISRFEISLPLAPADSDATRGAARSSPNR